MRIGWSAMLQSCRQALAPAARAARRWTAGPGARGPQQPLRALQAEFDGLHEDLDRMAAGLGSRLQYSLLLPRELAAHPVPARLLQPLVEASVRHCVTPKADGGHVLVSARREGAWLVLEVQDTGLGEAGAPGAPQGAAHGQVRERLQACYGAAARLEARAVPGTGATAIVRLPLAPP